jgi:hypothetical protein
MGLIKSERQSSAAERRAENEISENLNANSLSYLFTSSSLSGTGNSTGPNRDETYKIT